MKIQRSCTYLHKMFAARELKKGLDFCSSRTHVRHLSFPERSKYIFHTALNVALYKSAKIDKAKQVDFIKKKKMQTRAF